MLLILINSVRVPNFLNPYVINSMVVI
jgi:hypothetical protein